MSKRKENIGGILIAVPITISYFVGAYIIDKTIKSIILGTIIALIAFIMEIIGVYLLFKDTEQDRTLYLNRIYDLESENKRLRIIIDEFKTVLSKEK